MASVLSDIAGIQVQTSEFPPAAKPPGSTNTLFLAGAGPRGVEIQGKFVTVMAIGVYLEEKAMPWLSAKWKEKTAEEIKESAEFFKDIVTGPFEKFYCVTMVLPLTGEKFSQKVMENCVDIMKSAEIYTDAEAKAVDQFLEVFKDQNCPPGFSIFYSQSPTGSLAISFSKDGSVPEESNAHIENKPLSEAVLDSIIGTNGVSPALKLSLAERLTELFQ